MVVRWPRVFGLGSLVGWSWSDVDHRNGLHINKKRPHFCGLNWCYLWFEVLCLGTK